MQSLRSIKITFFRSQADSLRALSGSAQTELQLPTSQQTDAISLQWATCHLNLAKR